MKIFFCYERSNVGRWQPVCYHGAPPRPLNESKDDPPSRTSVVELPAEYVDADGTPNFGLITKRYPEPKTAVVPARTAS